MGVSTSSQAKKLSCSVQFVSIDLSYSSYICICHSVQLVFLWKCNGICGILKYGFQKSQTLAVRGWRGVSSPSNSCLTQADSSPSLVDQVWPAAPPGLLGKRWTSNPASSREKSDEIPIKEQIQIQKQWHKQIPYRAWWTRCDQQHIQDFLDKDGPASTRNKRRELQIKIQLQIRIQIQIQWHKQISYQIWWIRCDQPAPPWLKIEQRPAA